ncbi:MAG: cupin domain-containing protein [Pseudomonadota bacterium]
MEIFKTEEFINMENPTPNSTYKREILKGLHAQSLLGVFGLVVPGGQGGDVHSHDKGEHIILILSGEGVELVEGKEFPVKAGDILFVPAGLKHTILNRSNKDLRYLGFLSVGQG